MHGKTMGMHVECAHREDAFVYQGLRRYTLGVSTLELVARSCIACSGNSTGLDG